MLSKRLQAKGKTSTLQMGKLLNINVLMLVYVQNCKRVQSLISHPPITFFAVSS